jgi:cytochrome c554/c'-like protein
MLRAPLPATAVLVALAACSDPAARGPAAGGSPYVGARVCGECHEDRWAGFRRTAHHLTSGEPSRETVLGSFDPPANRLETGNPGLFFEMEARDGARYVTARYADGRSRSERIDVVVGSGKLGQTYLFWRGAGLFELPVSYLTSAGAWRNSPGTRYRDGTADFDRAIVPRCLECHATWFGISPSFAGGYVREGAVLGISCERCHGPGREHAEFHRANPESKEPVAVTNPADLPRERSLDLCGQCHGGVGELHDAPFSYRPGRPLEEHVTVPPVDPAAPPDVHSANQLVRLRQSRCFAESPKMTCATCHDPHVVERGDLVRFSKRCLSCHEPAACGMAGRLGHAIADDCVSCHMERLEIQSTVFDTPGATLHPTMVDHKVKVSRAATDRFLAGRPGKK